MMAGRGREPMEPLIREIEVEDAESFVSLRAQLQEESPFMLLEPGEGNRDPREEEVRIK